MTKLDEVRLLIDDIDSKIIELYEKRMDIILEVTKYKMENNIPVLDASREAAMLTKNINKIDKVTEKGLELFMKLTDEINQKNQEDAEKAEDVFSKKRPVVTYALLISNIVLFLTLLLCGSNPFNVLLISFRIEEIFVPLTPASSNVVREVYKLSISISFCPVCFSI